MLIYLLYPTFTLFSFIPTKDVFFSIFLNPAVKLYILISKRPPKPVFYIETAIYVLLSLFFRNNALYVFLALFIITVIVKEYRKIGLITTLFIPIVIYTFISHIVFSHLRIKPSKSAEKLSIPISQIANAYAHDNGSISTEDRDLIIQYIPDIVKYNPTFADPVKNSFENKRYNKNQKEYFELWYRIGKQYPAQYLKAALYLNIHYWYFDAQYLGPDTVPLYMSLSSHIIA